jgi:hypothetical protein
MSATGFDDALTGLPDVFLRAAGEAHALTFMSRSTGPAAEDAGSF